MKKTFVISGIILTSVIVLSSIYYILSSTETCNGFIVNFESSGDYMEFTIQNETTNERYTILADAHTNVYYCHHETDIYLGDLTSNLGSNVEATYKKYFNHNKYAKSIVVQVNHKN